MNREEAKFIAENIVDIFNVIMRGLPVGRTFVAHGHLRIDSYNINRLMDKIELIKAYVDGATIQYLDHRDGMWEDLTSPDFDSDVIEYRVKPKPREYTMVIGKKSGAIKGIYPKGHSFEYNTVANEYIKLKEVL